MIAFKRCFPQAGNRKQWYGSQHLPFSHSSNGALRTAWLSSLRLQTGFHPHGAGWQANCNITCCSQ
eukprot:2642032-Amphidinium_carterae.1